MYPVTHMAIAVGSVWVSKRSLNRIRTVTPTTASAIDYRIVALGALVPDLIDKPLAWVLVPGSFSDSHLYAHTLLFPIVLIAIGALIAQRGDLRLLAIGLGALTHPLVDPIVAYPQTLIWPLMGTDFAEPDIRLGFYQRIVEATLIVTGGIVWAADLGFRESARRLVRTGQIVWQRA